MAIGDTCRAQNRTSWQQGGKKIETHVKFPLVSAINSHRWPPCYQVCGTQNGLSLDPYLLSADTEAKKTQHARSAVVYDLWAVVEHQGRGLNQGHYTAYARDHESLTWYYFNDRSVSVTPDTKLDHCQGRYECAVAGDPLNHCFLACSIFVVLRAPTNHGGAFWAIKAPSFALSGPHDCVHKICLVN